MKYRVREYDCRVFVSGTVEGEASIIRKPLSFLGEVDSVTGDYLPDPPGKTNVAGKVLIIPYAIGSAGGSRILIQLVKRGKQPKGIISLRTPDTILTEGAILGKVPLVRCENDRILDEVEDGDMVTIDDRDSLIVARSTRVET
jgi:predicted aconitase with swiveling domain